MTSMIHTLKKATSMTVLSSQKSVGNATIEFLRYGIERKIGAIL